MTVATVETTLTGAVADAGTFTVGWPTGHVNGDFSAGLAHKAVIGGKLYTSPDDIGVAFTSDSVITITNRTGASIGAAGRRAIVELDIGAGDKVPGTNRTYEYGPGLFLVNLGAPDAADDDAICTVATAAGAGNYTINGAAASGGVATADYPRNVTLTGATTDHSARTFTITGTDEYGETVVETLAGPNNSTVSGKKAFKTVTQVAVDGAISTNGVKAGFGDVLGLPIFLRSTTCIVAELQDGAAATAGTKVAGLLPLTKSTATTADVRGTYDPNAACDGAKAFQLVIAAGDPQFLGNTQYDG